LKYQKKLSEIGQKISEMKDDRKSKLF